MAKWVKEDSILGLEIFRAMAPRRSRLITGHERSELEGQDAKRRWDYFYRPDVDAYYDYMADKYLTPVSRRQAKEREALGSEERNVEATTQQIAAAEKTVAFLKIRLPVVGLVALALVGVGAIIDMPYWFSAFGVILFLVASGVFSFFAKTEELKRARADLIDSQALIDSTRATIDRLERRLSETSEEIEDLFGAHPPTPSDSEIADALEKRLEQLQENALADCGLAGKDIILASGPIVLREWGYIQDETLPGYAQVPPHRHELVVANDDGILEFCCLYVQFVFVANDRIEVYGTFLDRISNANYGMLSNTFMYRHISNVRIASGTERKGFLSTLNGADVLTFELKVSSGDCISVTITDESIQSAIAESIGRNVRTDSTGVSLARGAVADIKKELLRKQGS